VNACIATSTRWLKAIPRENQENIFINSLLSAPFRAGCRLPEKSHLAEEYNQV
jgi:hypothetical protein